MANWARRARCWAEAATTDSASSSADRRLRASALPLAKTAWCWPCRRSKQQALAPLKAFVIPLGAGMNRHALKLAQELRAAGIAVDVSDESFRLKKSFETAEKLGATYAILVGENEVQADAFAVKNLKSGEQTTVARAELLAYLKD